MLPSVRPSVGQSVRPVLAHRSRTRSRNSTFGENISLALVTGAPIFGQKGQKSRSHRSVELSNWRRFGFLSAFPPGGLYVVATDLY